VVFVDRAGIGGGCLSYPGGKEGAGVWQRIVNLMPPHAVYVEPFAGGGAVLRHKREALREYAFDVDPAAVAALRDWAVGAGRRVVVQQQDALAWLRASVDLDASWLLYVDPPYPLSAQRTDRNRYRQDLTDEQHVELLELLGATPARVMVSGYRCPIYDAWLAEWRRIDYMASTRGRGLMVPESLWLNYEPPTTLHGYDRVGEGYRERERIKRKRRRWLANFAELPDLEREAIFSDLRNFQDQRSTENDE
jgi:DNA adenine methylase